MTANSSPFHPEKWGYGTPQSNKWGYRYPSYPPLINTPYIPTVVQLVQSSGDADDESTSRRWRLPRHASEELTQSLSVVVLEQRPPLSQSAIREAIVNADALTDIAGCDGFVAFPSVGVTVVIETPPPASAVVCISER